MRKVVIVSDDNCLIKQITNNIKKIKVKTFNIIYNTKEFKNYIINLPKTAENIIYLIDIYNLKDEFLEILKKIREQDIKSKIIIICMHENMDSLLKSRLLVYSCLEKKSDLDEKLKSTLSQILKNKEENLSNNFKLTEGAFPITINYEEIESIYRLSNEQIYIQYKQGNNNIFISINQATPKLRELTKDNFYIDKSTLKNSKRNSYTEPFKQLLVDLHLIFKIDCNTLSNHFHVDKKNIKKWASLSKYTRKINIIEFIIGKIIIKSYFKK